MIYILIRCMFGGLLCFFWSAFLRKKLYAQKMKRGLVFAGLVLLGVLVYVIPVENLFLRFAKEESAMFYSVKDFRRDSFVIHKQMIDDHNEIVFYAVESKEAPEIIVLQRDARGIKIPSKARLKLGFLSESFYVSITKTIFEPNVVVAENLNSFDFDVINATENGTLKYEEIDEIEASAGTKFSSFEYNGTKYHFSIIYGSFPQNYTLKINEREYDIKEKANFFNQIKEIFS